LPSGERSARVRRQRVGTGQGFGKSVCRQQFAFHQPGKILFFLLFGAEEQNGQRADSGMRGMPAGIGCVAAHHFRHHHHRGQVHLHAAELFRHRDAQQAKRGGLFQYLQRHAGFLFADGRQPGLNFIHPELLHHPLHGVMLVAQVFASEDFPRGDLFQKKSAAFSGAMRGDSGGHVCSSISSALHPYNRSLAQNARDFGRRLPLARFAHAFLRLSLRVRTIRLLPARRRRTWSRFHSGPCAAPSHWPWCRPCASRSCQRDGQWQ
jgi:hypothetical protein